MNTYLGFDFGTTNITMGLIRGDHIETHFTKFKPDIDPYALHDTVGDFLDEHLPYEVGGYPNHFAFIEGVFQGINPRTYQRMVRISHSLYIHLKEFGNDMHLDEMRVQVWRKLLFGKGNTKKEVAQEWAYNEWPLLLDYKKSERGHRADALCIAKAGRLLTEEYEKEARPRGDGEEY